MDAYVQGSMLQGLSIKDKVQEMSQTREGAVPYSKVRYVRLLDPPFQLTPHPKIPLNVGSFSALNT